MQRRDFPENSLQSIFSTPKSSPVRWSYTCFFPSTRAPGMPSRKPAHPADRSFIAADARIFKNLYRMMTAAGEKTTRGVREPRRRQATLSVKNHGASNMQCFYETVCIRYRSCEIQVVGWLFALVADLARRIAQIPKFKSDQPQTRPED